MVRALSRTGTLEESTPFEIEFFMHTSKTSTSHPLRIDSVAVPGVGGRIGLTFCPGKKQSAAQSGAWDRSLDDDLKVIKAFDAVALVTLMPDTELQSLRVHPHQIRDKASELSIEWYQLPIPDAGIPDNSFEELWADAGPSLDALLKAGLNIVIHCKGGLGRTGTVAARLLIEFGLDPQMAIQSVRKARPGSIENALQEKYVLSCGRKKDET
jgi:ADP-ribosyl-[dinitrogen reductase] hydrolase